jgi:L-asparaginase/Glu-tRNA(Gln) amidotransferase subunit D
MNTKEHKNKYLGTPPFVLIGSMRQWAKMTNNDQQLEMLEALSMALDQVDSETHGAVTFYQPKI